MAAVTAQEIAVACEALNRAPGLSPLARRLGIELVNHVDRATGTAWPSEARLAAALDVTTRAIRKAKTQLKAHGFLTWQQRGRHRQRTPLYKIAWNLLRDIAAGIKAKLKAAAEKFKRPDKQREINLGRNGCSSYLTQAKDLIGGLAKSAIQKRSQPSSENPALLNQRAQGRFYSILSALPPATYAQLLQTMTPDMEAQAIKAERYSPGTGFDMLKTLMSEQAV